MRHRKCGGVMKKILCTDKKVAYQCNKCGKVLTLYRRLLPVAVSEKKLKNSLTFGNTLARFLHTD